jgi:hypothetical protein
MTIAEFLKDMEADKTTSEEIKKKSLEQIHIWNEGALYGLVIDTLMDMGCPNDTIDAIFERLEDKIINLRKDGVDTAEKYFLKWVEYHYPDDEREPIVTKDGVFLMLDKDI